ncbi:MAG TPA: hypothetical protein VKP65_24860 [Rhodothermales bacterium]|nr:hypothetical protein [Rhodothermales bacterium]
MVPRTIVSLLAFGLLFAGCDQGGTASDPGGRVVLFDEAHENLHRADGTYRAFADLLRADGYKVRAHTVPFTPEALRRGNILVISNALHPSNRNVWREPFLPAFTAEEIAAVREWVEDGGGLLLIADHMPFPAAAENLAAAFGFYFSNSFAFDTLQLDRPSPCLQPDEIQLFRRADGTLANHPITNGRSEAERIDQVATFTGQAFQAVDEAVPLMTFGPGAVSLLPEVAWAFPPGTPRRSVDGWLQGALRQFGKGHVAFLAKQPCFPSSSATGMSPWG